MIKAILKSIICFIISVICISIILSNVTSDGYWPAAISSLILCINYYIWGLQ